MFSYTLVTKSFSTAVTDSAREAASDPMNSSVFGKRRGSNNGMNRLRHAPWTQGLRCDQPRGRQWRSTDYTSGPLPKSIDDGQRGLDIPGLGGDFDTLYHVPQLSADLPRNSNAFGCRG